MRNFKSLLFWQKSHQLVLSIYKLTSQFPKSELYGITSQLRRSALSIPTNISEGCGHTSNSQLKRYLDIAIGSASEVEYLLLFSKDIGYLNQAEYKLYDNNIVEIRKMLYTYKNTL